jgi:inosose dehydratase
MHKFKIGCQTYTWEMLGDDWKGSVDDILDIIAGAGYEGVEITNTMIGDYYGRPEEFAGALEARNLVFPSFGFIPHSSFTDASCIDDEIRRAEKGIDFVARFPGCRLDLAGGSTPDREDLDEKFKTMCGFYNRVAELADKKNVHVDVHPHSHSGSIIEKAEEYDRLMELTDEPIVGWTPDTGHIVRGGLDLLKTLKKYSGRIRNVHFKDVNSEGKWKVMGEGACDFEGVIKLLAEAGYKGWIIGEEESDDARRDQKSAVTKNMQYLKSIGQ